MNWKKKRKQTVSDYISKSALIENIKAEIQCVEKEKQGGRQ